MKDKFLQIPAPLRRQILIRCSGCGIGIIMMLLVFAYRGDWRFFLPCAALAIICLGSAAALFDQCVQSKYVVIEGVCTEIERSAIRKRIKAIYFRDDKFSIQLTAIRRVKNLTVGDPISVYVSENTSVYETDGCKVICNYLAMVKRGT